MAKLLVTGGAGFIGANFVHHWLREHPGDRLVVLDALTYAGNLANLDPVRDRPELRFVHANINDTARVETLLREERIDTLVHYPVAIPSQPAFAALAPTACSVADQVCRQVVSLPLYPGLGHAAVQEVVAAIRSFT